MSESERGCMREKENVGIEFTNYYYFLCTLLTASLLNSPP